MAFVLILAVIFLLLTGVLGLKKFQLYCLLTALACTILSIEIITRLDGLTLAFLTVSTVFCLQSINVRLYDTAGCLTIALPCVFWLSTQEFIDGFAYSHIFVALSVAVACNLLFDKQKRQTLCALVLLTSFVICYLSNIYFSVIDIATSFLIAIIFTQCFEYRFEISPLRSK